MIYPIEIIAELAGKYWSIKSIAVSEEIVEPFFKSHPKHIRSILIDGVRIRNFSGYEFILAEMGKRDTKLNEVYSQLSKLEEELKSADPQQVKFALERISDLNKVIIGTKCPVNKEHSWITPTCFDTGYDLNGGNYDFYSSYTICCICKNFVIDI